MALLAEMQFRRNCPTTEPFIQGARLAGRSCTKANTWRGSRELIELATAVQKPLPQRNQNHAPAGTEAIDEPIHPCPCCGSLMVIKPMHYQLVYSTRRCKEPI